MKFDFLSESDQAYFIHKASTLVEALPYIREHSGDTIVIKYGGHAMGDKKLSESFSRDIGLLKEVGVSPIIIHGGGPQIGERLKSKNISLCGFLICLHSFCTSSTYVCVYIYIYIYR